MRLPLLTFQLGHPSQLTLPRPRESHWILPIPDTLFCLRAFAQAVLAFWNTPSASPAQLSLNVTLLVMTGLADQVSAVPTHCHDSKHSALHFHVHLPPFSLRVFTPQHTSRLCDLCLEGVFITVKFCGCHTEGKALREHPTPSTRCKEL